MSSLTKKPLKKTTIKPLKKTTIKPLKKTTIKPLKKYLNKLKNIKKIGGDIEISRLGKLSDFINEAGSSIP
jgi:DNA/RNA endonuclease YhcR with UshA esterase domain